MSHISSCKDYLVYTNIGRGGLDILLYFGFKIWETLNYFLFSYISPLFLDFFHIFLIMGGMWDFWKYIPLHDLVYFWILRSAEVEPIKIPKDPLKMVLRDEKISDEQVGLCWVFKKS